MSNNPFRFDLGALLIATSSAVQLFMVHNSTYAYSCQGVKLVDHLVLGGILILEIVIQQAIRRKFHRWHWLAVGIFSAFNILFGMLISSTIC